MKVSRPHHLSKEAARAKVQEVLPALMRQYGSSISLVDATWEGDAVRFSFRAVGQRFRGILAATESHVVLDMAVPPPLRPFEGAIKSRVGQALEELFPPGLT